MEFTEEQVVLINSASFEVLAVIWDSIGVNHGLHTDAGNANVFEADFTNMAMATKVGVLAVSRLIASCMAADFHFGKELEEEAANTFQGAIPVIYRETMIHQLQHGVPENVIGSESNDNTE